MTFFGPLGMILIMRGFGDGLMSLKLFTRTLKSPSGPSTSVTASYWTPEAVSGTTANATSKHAIFAKKRGKKAEN